MNKIEIIKNIEASILSYNNGCCSANDVIVGIRRSLEDCDNAVNKTNDIHNVMPRISYFKDDNGVQFEPHYDEVLTDIKEDGTIEFYVIDSDYQRNILTPVYVA